jgi:hypothetical protein
MLEQLMDIIRAGGTLETNSLASRLGVSTQMVQALLEHLQRSGQILPYTACDEGCQGCSLKTACSAAPHAGQIHIWQSASQ